jgi:molybdopterin molybdotransferase
LLIIARPFILACQGVPIGSASLLPGFSREQALFDKPGSSREDYLRVRQTAEGVALYSSQSSGVLLSASHSDGLVRQSADLDIRRGDSVEFIPYAQFA